jgi:hypothetical protein
MIADIAQYRDEVVEIVAIDWTYIVKAEFLEPSSALPEVA